MADGIEDVDMTCVSALASVKDDRDRLEGYRTRAEAMKSQVNDVVYRRVVADYEAQRLDLERRSAPLTATARTQYERLLAVERRIRVSFEETRLAKEELEFRHAVGELTSDELRPRLAGPEETLARLTSELDVVGGLKEKFLSVVPSEKALLSSAAAPAPAPLAAAAPGSSPAVPPAALKTAVAVPDTNDTKVPVVLAGPNDTQISPTPTPTPVNLNDPPDTAAALAGFASESGLVPDSAVQTGARTFLVPDAMLEPVDDSTDGARFRLGVVTSIGRSAENHIRLVKAGVSRRHAVIRLTEQGFALEDLGSQNGTFVNGTRVPTHSLTDGDVIWIGDVKVMFKSAWTPPGSAAGKEAAGGDSVNASRRSRRS